MATTASCTRDTTTVHTMTTDGRTRARRRHPAKRARVVAAAIAAGATAGLMSAMAATPRRDRPAAPVAAQPVVVVQRPGATPAPSAAPVTASTARPVATTGAS